MKPDNEKNVKLLAFTSFFNDIASETTLRLLPLYLSHVLGASASVIGLIEGIAESTATLTKLLSGWLSDRFPRRKPFVVAGYALSGLTKPFLIFANHWGLVLFIRFADRLGKGVRTAPRDALVADISLEKDRGYSFGLIRALDMAGAFVGLAVAFFIVQGGGVLMTKATYQTIVLAAIVPAILPVVLVAIFVREAKRSREKRSRGSLKELSPRFWRYIGVVALFTMANSSDAFLVLRASKAHTGVAFILICLAATNIVSALIAVPAGRLSDRIGRKKLIIAGWVVYAATYAGFALLGPRSSTSAVIGLFLLYGAFYGLADGAQKSLVADLVDSRNRGLAYGIFSVAVGILSFPASLVFGIVMQRYGDSAAFFMGAAFALTAAVILASDLSLQKTPETQAFPKS